MNETLELARFAVSTGFDAIPGEVIERAKELFLDAIGATILGSLTPTGVTVAEYVKRSGCRPEVTVMGMGFRTSIPQAAFVNGSLLHSTELEADPMAQTGLPGQTILTSLAVGEERKASGKQALEAFVLGYELQGRIYLASPGIGRRGFLASNIVCTLGSAAAASKLIGLDAEGLSMALGIAASQAGGMVGQAGTGTHFLEVGMAARAGIESALLAEAGITGMSAIIENPQGFCRVFAGDDGYNLEGMCSDLGKSFLVVSPGLYVKKYPCCFRNHRALDAIFDLMKEHDIAYDQVACLETGINKWDAGLLKYPEPTTGMQTKFSLNHSLAAAILKGRSDWKWWTDESAVDPQFKEARSKVKVVFHPEWPPDRSQSRVPVKIELKDGRTFTKEIAEPTNPSRNEIVARYRQCAEPVLPPDAIQRSIDLILNLEKMTDISELTDLVRCEGR